MPDKHIKRLRYFTGQFLEASDFQAEQEYHVDMRRRGARALYSSAGILDDGFQVTPKPGDGTRIVISPGIGVDAQGRELIIVDFVEANLPAATHKQETYFVTLTYNEKPTNEQTPGDKDISDTTRIAEIPIVGFPRSNKEDDKKEYDEAISIVIATITLDATGKISGELSSSGRKYANARFPRNLTVGTGANGENYKLSIQAPNSPTGIAGHQDISYEFAYAGSARIRAYRGNSWGTSLQLLTNSPSNVSDSPDVRLHIDETGKVGIGTAKPSVKLEVAGGGGTSVDLLVNGRLRSNNNDGGLWVALDRFIGGHSTNKIGIYTNNSPQLTVDSNGHVGIGTLDPGTYRLKVEGGDTRLAADGKVQSLFGLKSLVGKGNLGFYVDDLGGTPVMYLDSGGQLGIGTSIPGAKLHVSGGAIMPAMGNMATAGIQFPADPGGGSGDAAWIRYYARDGVEKTALELGVSNDELNNKAAQDDILLMPSGGVGIGTRTPNAKLQVSGGAIMPEVGKSDTAGIQFPNHANGGVGKGAWIRYYADSGTYALEIGVDASTPKDRLENDILLRPSGKVKIGLGGPKEALHVNGNVFVSGNIVSSGLVAVLTKREIGPSILTFKDFLPDTEYHSIPETEMQIFLAVKASIDVCLRFSNIKASANSSSYSEAKILINFDGRRCGPSVVIPVNFSDITVNVRLDQRTAGNHTVYAECTAFDSSANEVTVTWNGFASISVNNR